MTSAAVADADACFHCGLPVPAGTSYLAVVDGAPRAMCCPGCVAVAGLIVASGFEAYYRHREAPGGNPERVARPPAELLQFDAPAVARTFVRSDGALRTATLALEGMRCAACAWLVERRLRAEPGVADVRVSLGSARAEVTWRAEETQLGRLLGAVGALGYGAHPYRPDWEESRRRDERRAALMRIAVAGLAGMQIMMLAIGLYAGALQGMAVAHRDFLRVVSAILATPIVVVAARPFLAGAWRDLRNRRLGMDVPIALAIVVTFAASLVATATGGGEVYFDSIAMFVLLLSLARFVEMRARQRAAASVDAALRQPPATATRLGAGGSALVLVQELRPGDRVLVRPGEVVPADGRVVEGRGWVNEAMLTGEEWPRAKRPGDAVIGGTVNGESPLTVVLERTGADTVLADVARLVDRAAAGRPAIARLADRVARVFVPLVLAAAAFTAVGWWAVDPARAFWVALSVLVVTCPCALSLATPAALTAAAGGLLRRGLLITRGHVLETLAVATHVVFDKTGTLTHGRVRLARIVPVGTRPIEAYRTIAAALEWSSEHPIARAFDRTGVAAAHDVEATAGAGVAGIVDGRRWRIGATAWAAGCADPAPVAPAGDGTWVLLADEDGPQCWFELEDTLRSEAAVTVQRLAALGLTVELVSGDALRTVAALGRRLGIATACGGATPETKLRHVQELQAAGAIVLMVGDGMNDAPVLGAADVSVAMGGGTALARRHADAVLLREDLGVLVEALTTARATHRTMVANLGWAIAYNLVALPLAVAGLVTPYWAALGMSASSLVVVLNAARLGRVREPARPAPRSADVLRPVEAAA